jgi:hypothetical protein
MTALFKEFESYESELKQSIALRRLCYIMTMLLSDGVYHDLFWNEFMNENDARRFSEENFYIEHYDRLIGIFPRARYMFNKKKFLDE